MSNVFQEEISPISFETERYLASLFENGELGISRLSTTELSDQLNLHPATISNKLKSIKDMRISDHKIFSYEKRYGTKLTPAGIALGGKIVRKKRMKELMIKKLGLTLWEIDQQINYVRITDSISDLLYEEFVKKASSYKIDDVSNSLRCPHGSLIPDASGRVPFEIFNTISYYPTESELTLHRLPLYVSQKLRSKYYKLINDYNLKPGDHILSWKMIDKKKISICMLDGQTIITDLELIELLYFTDRNYNYYIPYS